MAPITTATEINQAPEDVFAYITDPARFAEWQRKVVDGYMDTNSPTTMETRCVTTRRIGLATRAVTSEITHMSPPRRWGVRGIDGPIRAIVNVNIDPLDEGQRSRLTIDIDFEGHGIGKLLVPLVVRRQARAEMPVNLRRAKERIEAIG